MKLHNKQSCKVLVADIIRRMLKVKLNIVSELKDTNMCQLQQAEIFIILFIIIN